MSGARATVINKNTGLTRTGPTNPRGEFLAPFLPAGEYSISVESQGFKRASVATFTLQVDQNATIRVRLTPGDVVETVQMTETTPLLEADTSSLGQVIENKKILELPLNGRNPFALGLLAGNTTPMFGMGTNLPFIEGTRLRPFPRNPFPCRAFLPPLRSGSTFSFRHLDEAEHLPPQSKHQRRFAPIAVRFQPGILFAFPSERCSASPESPT